jgi:hypothetical protein
MNRRSVLMGGLAATLGGSLARAAPPPVASGPLSVEIDLDGRTFRYNEAAGRDIGDYRDPAGQFVQGCVLASHPDLPLYVMFRRDRQSPRFEIVFELGRAFAGTPANLGAYQVRVLSGEETLGRIGVPQHYWFSRWRVQSAPRPVRIAAGDLIARGLLPPYSARAIPVGAPEGRPQVYEVMGLAGVNPYMGTTGEREDIGPLTEPQAEFLCTRSQVALQTTMSQAEAGGTIPWNIRDARTGAPVDVLANPHATIYGPGPDNVVIPRTRTPISADQAHQPALAYLPFLLTGDPYHLETLQFQSTFNKLFFLWQNRLSTGQVRGHAWSLRTLAQTVRVTPPDVPSWLLPQRTWKTLLDQQREQMTRDFVQNPDPLRAVFRTIDQNFGDRATGALQPGTYFAPWQGEFETFILGWLVAMGFQEWQPAYRWSLGSTLARTDGRSGWVRAYGTPYVMALRPQRDAPWARSWAEAWALNARLQNWQVRDPDRWMGTPTYLSYTWGALAMARHLGVAEAGPCAAWANGQIRDVAAQGQRFPYRWAVG